MNKQDFIDRLRMALNGRVSPGLVMDNVNYYEDYINTEIRKGRTEEEVLESLGDPRLIARTIIQTNGGDNRSGYRNTVYGNGEYREAAGSTVHHSYNGRVGAVCLSGVLARFLHGAPDAQPLHVLVGRYFRVDMVSLDHQRQRHAHDEEGYGAEGEEEND